MQIFSPWGWLASARMVPFMVVVIFRTTASPRPLPADTWLRARSVR